MDSTIQEQKPASSTSVSSTTLDAGERSHSVLVADAQNPFPRHMESALDIEKQEKNDSDYDEPRWRRRLNRARKHLIVPLLCSAQFFDIVCSSSSIIALPQIGDTLNFQSSELQWVIAAYTLTFASFQLIGGRLADIYHPKPVFITGCTIVGIFSILCGVSVHPIMLIVFRAVQGIGAALTIPPAVALIVQTIPNPVEQSKALAAFGASGAVGNALGFVIGGVLTSKLGWRWVFYLVAILILPISAIAIILLPNPSDNGKKEVTGSRKRSLDIPGVLTLTIGIILFVYAISDASNSGWGKPKIIVTLILSVLLVAVFFIVEQKVADPAVPPSTWSTPNVVPLFVYSLSIYWFMYGVELQLVEIFQVIFGWSPLSSALHCLPIGVAGGLAAHLSGLYGPLLPRRLLLASGQLFFAIAAILFALADSPEKYWSHVFPGMVVGMIGIGIAYVGVNVAVMASARKGEEGVIGALVNMAFQLGATIGLAILTSITLGVNDNLPVNAPVGAQLAGYKDSFWSLVGFHGLMIVVSVIFVR